MRHQTRSLTLSVLCAVGLLVGQALARATSVTVDQYIFQNGTGVTPGLLSGTVDITGFGTTTLTITLKNTSPDGAFTDPSSPALMLLTGIGLQLPGVDIIGGSVAVAGGSTALNFDAGQSTTAIGNQWNYANAALDGYLMPGVLAIDTMMSSVNNGQATRFAGPPPGNINGPDYGAISALETQFGSSQAAVRDTIVITLNLSGNAPSFATINGGNIVLAFGSPDSVPGVPDGGSTLMLFGSALAGLGYLTRRRKT